MMICSNCHELTDNVEECAACGQSPILDGRYRLDELLGAGAAGTTFRATLLENGERVAIKELDWRKLDALKTEELFQREAAVLEQLDHPGIPQYFETFTIESGRHVAAYIVQEFIDGGTLDQEQQSRRYELDDVLAIGEELLEIVAYLHARTPPVIHRDIKPKNVMRRKAGDLVLIDFGSVREVAHREGGSTVAGTIGYMAPEQLAGIAVPGSDIYGVGALILALLSRQDPSQYLGPGKGENWRDVTDLDRATEVFLEILLEPSPDERADDARFVQQWIRDLRAGDVEVDGPESDPVVFAPDDDDEPVEQVPTPPTKRVGLVTIGLFLALTSMGVVVALTPATSNSPPAAAPLPPPPPQVSVEMVGQVGNYFTLGMPRSEAPTFFEATEEPNILKGEAILARYPWDCELIFTSDLPSAYLEEFICISPPLVGEGWKSPKKMTEFIFLKYGEPVRVDDQTWKWSSENEMTLTTNPDLDNRLKLVGRTK